MPTDQALTRQEFAASIKAKYPDYATVADDDLVDRMLVKYPVYRDRLVDFKSHAEPPQERRALATIGDVVGDVGIGAMKGAISTVSNIGDLARKIPGVSALDSLMTPIPVNTTPSNTAQSIGKGVEQIGEVLVPGRAITKAGTTAARLAAPYIGRLVPKMAVEAGGGAALSLAQGGNPLVGGAISAVSPVIGAVAGAAAPKLKEGAETLVTQALGATKERYKAMAQRLAPEILKRGLRGSRESIQQRAAETLETVGEQLDTVLQSVGDQPVSVQPVLEALETAKDAFRTPKNMTVQEALQRGYIQMGNTGGTLAEGATMHPNGSVQVLVELEPRAIRQLSGLQRIIETVGPISNVAQLRAVRQAWDKVVSQAGGYAQRAPGAIGVPLKDQAEASVKREGANAIRALLADEVPTLAAVNKEYSFWKGLDEVLTQTLQRTQPQSKGLGRIAAEGAGQMVGGIAGSSAGPAGAVGGAILVGKLADMAKTVFASPRWKLASAQTRNRLADAIASGNAVRIQGELLRIGGVQASKAPALSSP